jgi:Arc/MetJ-type ribon-helix-helix transcriptional regulator
LIVKPGFKSRERKPAGTSPGKNREILPMTKPSNGLDKAAAKSFVDSIESHLADLASERGAYMNRCRGIREAITAVYDDAKGKGIRKKALQVHIKERGLEQKILNLRNSMEEDDHENYILLVEAVAGLEGTPLGDAAVEADRAAGRGRRVKKTGSALDSLDDGGDPRPAA